jgi:DNA-directed RNA polymerase specialized sigma24 family protein
VKSVDPLAEVFTGQYTSLVRLAAMLLDDPHNAEDIVHDAYLRTATRHYRLRDPNKALAYLRQTVVNLARNSLRHQLVVRRHAAVAASDAVVSAEEAALERFEQLAVVRALRDLPLRHREVWSCATTSTSRSRRRRRCSASAQVRSKPTHHEAPNSSRFCSTDGRSHDGR